MWEQRCAVRRVVREGSCGLKKVNWLVGCVSDVYELHVDRTTGHVKRIVVLSLLLCFASDLTFTISTLILHRCLDEESKLERDFINNLLADPCRFCLLVEITPN